MCNLYSLTKSQKAIIELVKAIRDLTGNMPPMPSIFPNGRCPIVRTGEDGVREMVYSRWGWVPPAIPGAKPRNPYLTNIRDTDSRFWLPALKKTSQRCLVPVTAFAEPSYQNGPKAEWVWFSQDDSRPIMFFAGVSKTHEGDRGTKSNPDVGTHTAMAFLTTDASQDVVLIHPDATPALLLSEEDREKWMNAPWEIARDLQKPPPPGALKIVARGSKQDNG